jgi:MoxR-like ATPase
LGRDPEVRDTADENLKARLDLWRENLETATASMTTIALAEIGSGSDIPSGTKELMALLVDPGDDDLSIRVEPSPTGRAAALLVLQAGQTLRDFQPIYTVSLLRPQPAGRWSFKWRKRRDSMVAGTREG